MGAAAYERLKKRKKPSKVCVVYYIKEKRVERERVCHFDNDTPSFFPSVTFYISIISRLVIVPFKNFSCVRNSRVAQDFIPSLDFEIIIKICIYISMECYNNNNEILYIRSNGLKKKMLQTSSISS